MSVATPISGAPLHDAAMSGGSPPIGHAPTPADTEILIATMAGTEVLAQCTRQELSRLVPFFRHRELQPGETLCEAGQPAGDMWLLLDGTLRMERTDHMTQEVSAGFVGEEAALGIGCYLSRIVAVGRTTVAALGKDVIPHALGGQNPRAEAFGRSLIRAFAPTPFDEPPPEVDHDRLTPAMAVRKSLGWLAAVGLPLWFLDKVPNGALLWEQRQLTAVLISAAALWMFGAVPPYVAALLVILVCVTLGIVPAGVALSGYASNGFFLALSIFCLGAVLVESGVVNRLRHIAMKRCPRSAFWHDLAAMGAGIALTPLVASSRDRARVLAPLAVEAAETLGYANGSRDRTRLLLATFMGLTLLSPMFLTGGGINLLLYGSLPEQAQVNIPMLRWTVGALPAAAVMLLAYLVAYLAVFRNGAVPRTPDVIVDAQLRVLGPVRTGEWVAVGGVLVFLIAIASVNVHKVDHRLIALTIVCGYLLLGQLGKVELNLHIDWSVLMLLGSVIGVIATIVYTNLHEVMAAAWPWLTDTMKYEPRLFVAMLAAAVVLGELLIPIAGTLIGIVAVPLAIVNGMTPWVIIFVILLMSDAWFLPRQSETYRMFRASVRRNSAFDEPFFLRFNGVMAMARIVALIVSIPYWEALRIL
ncbi:MAG: SLC13 family permease [Gammaproteobacteria bacterium]